MEKQNTKLNFWTAIIIALISGFISIITSAVNKYIDKPITEDIFTQKYVQKWVNKTLQSDTTSVLISSKVNNYLKQDMDRVPVGTIISSIINYDSFMTLNDFKPSKNTREVIWVPCDGRIVMNSKYSNFKNTVPDLRGLFLRNVNDYGVEFSGIKDVDSQWKNPENKDAGQKQKDQVGNHSHFKKWYPVQGREGSPAFGIHPNFKQFNDNEKIAYHFFNEGKETRPKNMTVYYYIKIN